MGFDNVGFRIGVSNRDNSLVRVRVIRVRLWFRATVKVGISLSVRGLLVGATFFFNTVGFK